MIRWTSAGAVSEPETLQVRVAPDLAGRIGAGAPVPSRAMTAGEVSANVRHFTEQRRGPRTQPCTTLVLTGLTEGPDLGPVAVEARGLGVTRIVLHVGAPTPAALALANSPLGADADAVVARVSSPEEAARVGAIAEVTAVVVLEAATLPELPGIVDALVAGWPARVVLMWPLSGADVPNAVDAAAAARPALERLARAGIAAGIKGIPLCTLAPGPAARESWEDRVWRSTNRFYVDADHQRDEALVFFPDVVRFAKTDSCRFCAAVLRCDGVVETWLRRGLAGPLVPLS